MEIYGNNTKNKIIIHTWKKLILKHDAKNFIALRKDAGFPTCEEIIKHYWIKLEIIRIYTLQTFIVEINGNNINIKIMIHTWKKWILKHYLSNYSILWKDVGFPTFKENIKRYWIKFHVIIIYTLEPFTIEINGNNLKIKIIYSWKKLILKHVSNSYSTLREDVWFPNFQEIIKSYWIKLHVIIIYNLEPFAIEVNGNIVKIKIINSHFKK